MEQTKRSRNNYLHDYDDTKRKKIDKTRFEDISNELIYEIFEFLDFHHAFESFYDLNIRFQNLFVYSNFPIKINISSTSKSTLQRYLKHIVIPYTYRITSLRLVNPFVADMILLLSPIMLNLTQLQALSLNNIESDYVEAVIDRLTFLPFLSSLVIISTDSIRNQNDIYQKIFRLPVLKYCKILIQSSGYPTAIPIATNEFSPIEYLIINSKVAIDQLSNLLSYVPQLRRLSIGHLDGPRNRRTPNSFINLNYLTDVSLKLYSVSFNDFEILMTDFFRQIQVLRLVTRFRRYFTADMEYLNADRWERLIAMHMPNLYIFDFQHHYSTSSRWPNNNIRQTYETQVYKFNSLFWMKHQWFFEYQYNQKRRNHNAFFYSTDPYRRKYYMLHEESNKSIWSTCPQTNVNSVDHVYIHNNNAMEKFVGHFSNATKLTISETFNLPRDSILNNLNRIIPLRQLSQIILDCHRFPLMQIIELLYFAPNVDTLKVYSILRQQKDIISFQQSQTFQIVSKMNKVTNLTIEKESTLDKIQLIAALFPRLKYLTINLQTDGLEPIARFLLSQPVQYLSSLCISKKQTDFLGKLRILIESEKLLHDYIIKFVDHKLYLWW